MAVILVIVCFLYVSDIFICCLKDDLLSRLLWRLKFAQFQHLSPFLKVRVGFLHPSSSEGCKNTKCLAQHKGAAHKVSSGQYVLINTSHSRVKRKLFLYW